jgi:hypothetical protein
MVTFFLIISLLLNAGLGFLVVRAASRISIYEDYCETVLVEIRKVLHQIRGVDIRGSFEADDEVGVVYKGISGLVRSLETFLPEESDGSEEAE